MIKKAMILAAGFGKRLNPLTVDCPKPLLKVDDETLLSNTIRFLENLGIEQVVINVHYLKKKIINYIKKKNFNLIINIVEEKNVILDTGGGVLNAINHFSNKAFVIINPDTLWNLNYVSEFKLMENDFMQNKKTKCVLLVVKKKKSFDKNFKGDFNLKNKLIDRNNENDLEFIYTGLQIIKPEVFNDLEKGSFSINKVWNQLIKKNELYGLESNIDFLHISTLDIYKTLIKKKII
jgi:MurNAc alpha-1-phosphate uridylyltransferase